MLDQTTETCFMWNGAALTEGAVRVNAFTVLCAAASIRPQRESLLATTPVTGRDVHTDVITQLAGELLTVTKRCSCKSATTITFQLSPDLKTFPRSFK